MNPKAGKERPKPREHTRLFTCPECNLMEGMKGDEFKKHLAEKHGITEIKGTQSLVMALDGSDFYSNTYEITISGKKFGMTNSGPRGRSA
jgi:hypothetical protein